MPSPCSLHKLSKHLWKKRRRRRLRNCNFEVRFLGSLEMVRAPCCEKMGLKKGPWTADEDRVLISYIQQHGHSNWRALPKLAGLLRCGKSCRLRWTNYLRPDIKRGNFTKEEEGTVLQLHEKLGNRWSAIAAKLPGRTDNEIKNFWHTHLKKRLLKQTDSAIATTESKPQKLDQYPNHQELPSSSLDFSSVSESSTTAWEDYGYIEGFDFFEAFDQTDGGLWTETPSSASVNYEEQFQPFEVMDQMKFGFCYDDGTKMDESMEFWYEVFVKAGGSLNDAAVLIP